MTVSLAGTRTSHRWADVPGSFDTVNARAIYPSSNEYGIPDLPLTHGQPARLLSYSDRAAIERSAPGDAIHYFLDDYRFEVCWSKPERPLTRLAKVGTSLTPDFSLYAGMPIAMQLWQVYRSRWCGAWMLEHGIQVIPTVSWSTQESYNFAFAGIAVESVVAISSVGIKRDSEAARLFADGLAELRDTIEPSLVLSYGKIPPSMRPDDMDIREYPTRWDR